MRRAPGTFALTALSALLLLVLATLAIAPPLLDWNRHRDALSLMLSHALEERVYLEGEVSLRLLPVPLLEAREVSLGDGVRIEALTLDADWFALLGGSLHARSATAQGMKIHLTRAGGEEAWRLPFERLPVEEIRIEEGVILLRDEVLGLEREVQLDSARIEAGRLRAMFATPDSPLGESVELRAAMESIADASGDREMSLTANFPKGELRLSGMGRITNQALRLQGALDARLMRLGEEIQLRSELHIGEGMARFSELSLQWGETHWRGGGEVTALTGKPSATLSLQTGIFEARQLADMLEGFFNFPERMETWLPLQGSLSLQAESVVLEDGSLGAGRLEAGLDDGKATLNLALEELPGGGSLRWDARANRNADGFAPLVGDFSLAMERPERFASLPFLGALKKPLRLEGALTWSQEKTLGRLESMRLRHGGSLLQGRILYDPNASFVWQGEGQAGRLVLEDGIDMLAALEGMETSAESRLSLFADALLADGTKLGKISTRLRLLRETIMLESLRLGDTETGLSLQASGSLFRSVEAPEGRIDLHLDAAGTDARARVGAMLMAAGIEEGSWIEGDAPLSLQSEWRLEPETPDRLSLIGESGEAKWDVRAEGVFALLQEKEEEAEKEEEEALSAPAPLRVFWRRQQDSLMLEGMLFDAPEFLRAHVKARGADIEDFASFWLTSLFGGEALKEDGDGEAKPFALEAELTGVSGDEGRRLVWKEMQVSQPKSVRSNGWIGESPVGDSFHLQADFDLGDIAPSDLSALPFLREIIERGFGASDGTGLLSARGRLFDGNARFELDIPAELSRSRFHLALSGADLEQASLWLWEEAVLRGALDVSLETSGDFRNVAALMGVGEARLLDGEVCCIDIAGLRGQANEGTAVVAAFAPPLLERGTWTPLGTGDFSLALGEGLIKQRSINGLEAGASIAAQLDIKTHALQLQADFPIAVGPNGERAPLTYIIEGELLAPLVAFDAVVLEQAFENLRLQNLLEHLDASQ